MGNDQGQIDALRSSIELTQQDNATTKSSTHKSQFGDPTAEEEKNWHWRLDRWLEKAPDEDWKAIGNEVKFRKGLFLAAAETLRAITYDDNNAPKHYWKLAAADVFVEKASAKLTARAGKFMVAGALLAGVAIAVTVTTVVFIYSKSLSELFDHHEPNGYLTTVVALKSSAVAIFAGGIIVFLTSLSKAMFHEGISLYQRRHALRFGRLYVYLKDGEVNFQEMEEAFQWNREFYTAFKDMKISSMTSTPDKALEAATKLAGATSEIGQSIISKIKETPKSGRG